MTNIEENYYVKGRTLYQNIEQFSIQLERKHQKESDTEMETGPSQSQGSVEQDLKIWCHLVFD